MAHSVCHFEVLADDIERAKRFYADAFGWTFEAWGPPDFYLIRTGPPADPGITEGALAKRAERPASGVNGYRCTITVADLDQAMAAIVSAGGRITSEVVAIPGVGTVASFEDSEGNAVAVMQYAPGDPRAVSAR